MTSNTHHRGNVVRRRRPAGGFTLTEMLVVIGIVVLVLGITTPMVTRAWKAGDRTRTAADLQAIASALEAYRQDHKAYPEVPAGQLWPNGPADYNGARTLTRWLVAPGPATGNPQDIPDGEGASTGAPGTRGGAGFRARRLPGPDGRYDTPDDVFQGPVFGPYLKPEQFKLANADGATTPVFGNLCILDRYNKPILYYRATGKPNIRQQNGYVAQRQNDVRPLYNVLDNWDRSTNAGAMSTETLRRMMGDYNANGMIDPNETPAYEGPFLLWSAGPDEVFGPPPMMPVGAPDQVRRAVEKSDDITNFRN